MSLHSRFFATLIATTLAFGALGASAQTTPATVSASKETIPPGFSKDDLKELLPDGAKFLDVQTGDLTGHGDMGALVVIDPYFDRKESGSGPARTLLLVDRDAQGHLRTLARNSKMVLCANCGSWSTGDAYGYARIDPPGHFIVVQEGGSSLARWSDQYHFRYAPRLKTWVVDSVVRGVGDQSTGQARQIKLSAKRLGVIKLNDFDPAPLPHAKLK